MIRDIDRNYFYDGKLGAIYSESETTFRVWSPLAENVVLKLYFTDNNGDKYIKDYKMTESLKGVWEYTASGDLDGIYYAYDITHNGVTKLTADINAVAGGVNGRLSMVVNLEKTNPDGWKNSQFIRLDKQNDAVIYELHVRDFSIDKSGNFSNRGKFTAFTEFGLTNKNGDKIGIDHIKELGVTHVHLLPVFDFATIDENLADGGFNWGYDPQNFNFPEGSYSTDPYDGRVRITEFKKLVAALHNQGIGVVMDVVYNHTYDLENSAFTKTFPRYYYRSFGRKYSDGSACGNEFATDRAMARKFILDSLCFWAEEYKLDGFRFDLMGLYDIKTVNLLCQRLHEINPAMLLYGEGWTGGKSPLSEKFRAMKSNAEKMPLMAMFSDDFRDTVKGDVFINEHAGFVNGGNVSADKVMSVMAGGISHPQIKNNSLWTDSPSQAVNYVEAHDNLTLWDKLFYTTPNADEKERIEMDKLASVMVFLSQGIPFIQAGQEFLRSKPLPDGGFDHNSYSSPDSVNSIKWDRKSTYYDVYEFYKGLIEIRKKYDVFRMKDGEEIRNSMTFTNMDGLIQINYGRGFVLFLNNSNETKTAQLNGRYGILVNQNTASADEFAYVEEGVVNIAPVSALLLKLNLS